MSESKPEDDDAKAMRYLILNLIRHKPSNSGVPLWSVVKDLIGCGQTVATKLVRRHGFDPETVVIKPAWYDCERTHVQGYCPDHMNFFDLMAVCEECAKEEAYYAEHPEARPSIYPDEPGSVGGV